MPFTKTFTAGEILTASDVNEHLLNGGYQYRETVYYTSSGTFVKADYPWLRAIRVKVQAGGGAGGGCNAAGASEAGFCEGGGGGGYAESFITDIAGLDATEPVTRGAGGAPLSGSGTGGAGVASSFGTLVAASGGGGGTGNVSTTSGITVETNDGGIGTAGDLLLPGSPSNFGVFALGGNFANFRSSSGSGGDSVLGTGGLPRRAGGNGVPGAGFGGGGGGAFTPTGQTARSGGAGANGIVIVELYA